MRNRAFLFLTLALIFSLLAACGAPAAEAPAAPAPAAATEAPTEAPTEAAKTEAAAYISGVDTCPTSKEYGDLVLPKVNIYRTTEALNIIGTVPHGAQIETFGQDGDMIEVEYHGVRGYVQSYTVVDYDPMTGVRPSNLSCL